MTSISYFSRHRHMRRRLVHPISKTDSFFERRDHEKR
jgi:hypothetical protein